MRKTPALAVLLAAVAGSLIYALRPATQSPSADTPVTEALAGGSNEGFARAYVPRPFRFPEDNGPHPDFRVEWWYVTGNLAATDGRRFGYQLTLFRYALSPTAPPHDSAWRTNQLYMGHFAITDVAGGRHYGFERLSRAAVGLAGAQAVPFRVWLENWSLGAAAAAGGSGSLFPLRVSAREGALGLELTLDTAKPLVLQGERGLSRKSAEPGNASYYYSYTRLPTQGTLRLDGEKLEVSGSSWLDREWSTSALGPQQSGWDWFALQLDDGRDLMFYRLRLKNGGIDPHSSGVLVAGDGSGRPLGRADLELTPLDTWTSPHTGDRYPIRWRLRLPALGLDLTIAARVADQEMRVTTRYWEGAVSVQGRSAAGPVTGQGYLEMTRYGMERERVFRTSP